MPHLTPSRKSPYRLRSVPWGRRYPGCGERWEWIPAKRLTSPTVGLIPARQLAEEGHVIEPSVSLPSPGGSEVSSDGRACTDP